LASASDIAQHIIAAVLTGRLPPGTRLGEAQLATVYGVSRTIVREALTRLSTRGIVTLSSRRGWFVVEPSVAEAHEAFEARKIIETGLLRRIASLPRSAIKQLKAHVARERAAIRAGDVGTRTHLLGDFHVCLAECIGNGLLADLLRDLTARTTLISMLYQSSHQAEHSCTEHADIVAALERGDVARAVTLMEAHIGHVEAGLNRSAVVDPVGRLRDALAPARELLGATPASPSKRPAA
jgi:DNA-binding GntR family transcriptional regulator